MPEAGWYEPEGGEPGKQRYWDGEQWTDRVRPTPPPAPGAPPPAQGDAREWYQKKRFLIPGALLLLALLGGILVEGPDGGTDSLASDEPTPEETVSPEGSEPTEEPEPTQEPEPTEEPEPTQEPEPTEEPGATSSYTSADEYDPYLEALADDCLDGIQAACDELYTISDLGSDYEALALREGGNYEPDLYGDGAGIGDGEMRDLIVGMALDSAWNALSSSEQVDVCFVYNTDPDVAYAFFTSEANEFTRSEFDSFFSDVC